MDADFVIRDAKQEDLDAIALLIARSYDQLPLWRLMVQEVEPAALHELLLNFTRNRFRQSIYKYFVAVDAANSTIAGCTGLSLPRRDEEGEPELAGEWPTGMNEALANRFFGPLVTQIKDYGYNPKLHFRRAGTFIAPEYQKRGLGTRLTRHCNAIADEAGSSTYVTAISEVALYMFEKEGFAKLGSLDTNLEEFGGQELLTRSYACCRVVKPRDNSV